MKNYVYWHMYNFFYAEIKEKLIDSVECEVKNENLFIELF